MEDCSPSPGEDGPAPDAYVHCGPQSERFEGLVPGDAQDSVVSGSPSNVISRTDLCALPAVRDRSHRTVPITEYVHGMISAKNKTCVVCGTDLLFQSYNKCHKKVCTAARDITNGTSG